MGIELSERNHDLLDRFLANALDGYRSGEITLAEARLALAHVIAAAADDNFEQVVPFMELKLKAWKTTA
jgi:hypothetical protein